MFRALVPMLIALSVTPSAFGQGAPVMTLSGMMSVLDDNSLDLALADEAVEQAENARALAATALRPTITLSGQYTLRDEQIEQDFGSPFAAISPYFEAVSAEHGADYDLPDPAIFGAEASAASVIQYRHDLYGSLVLDQVLFNARALPYLRQTEVGIRQAENGHALVRHQVQGALTRAYFFAVLQKRLVEAAARNRELAHIAHERAQIAFDEDVGIHFAVNRAEVELSRADRAVENARTRYAIAIEELATIANIAPDFDVEAPEWVSLPADSLTTPADTPVLRAHELQLERQGHRIDEARAQWFPQFLARAQANVQRESAFFGDRFNWSVQVGANWDLYARGARRIERRLREQEAAEEQARRAVTLQRLASELAGLSLEVEQLERDIASAAADATLARENVALTETALSLGVASDLDTQVAREQLYVSELALAQAEVSLLALVYELQRLVGAAPWQ